MQFVRLIYLSSSVGLCAEGDCGWGRAGDCGGSEGFGGVAGVWDSWDDAGRGAAAFGDN